MQNLLKITALAALTLFVAATPARADVKGTYVRVGPVPANNSLPVVQFEEFINFTCPHCNNFRSASKGLKEKLGARLKITYVPILFRGQTDFPLRLFYLAESEGKGEEVKDMIFDAAFRYGVNIYDPGVVSYLARSAGLGERFAAEAQADWVTQRVRAGFARASEVGVRATPTVVLQGALRVSPETGMEAFVANLDNLIGQLLKPGS